jgi:FAD/FMN-containing dehydrogenase
VSQANSFIAELQGLLGQAHVLLPDGDALVAFERDWRGRVRGKALAVVRPGNAEQVAQVVKACAAAGVSVVPQGGNTGLVLGGIPDDTGTQVLLSTQRMNRVRALDSANSTITVEAGCVLQAVQQAAAGAGMLFPLSLAAEGSCTIGGNLATNAGGTQVLRYGNARDLCLGLEWVTAQGEVIHALSGLRKDNTGYDLRHLMVGSEGTLGIITAATLRLFPMPQHRATAWLAFDGLPAAVQALQHLQGHLGAALTGFEVMGRFALELTAKQFAQLPVPLLQSAAMPFFALIEASFTGAQADPQLALEGALEGLFESGVVQDAAVAQSIEQSNAMWHVRESIPLAQAQEGLNIKHDISLPISSIPAFCEQTDALLRTKFEGVRLVNFGHLGDGNLHYNVQCPQGGDAAAFLVANEHAVNQLVYEQVASHGGSISAEHGIGSLKRDELAQYKSPAALALMRQIKRALDPMNTLNPGRVV